ncbi:MAG: ferritin-like domain-containing protein [Ktedonobacteraceae bacterium]|nr:ferritin-like domain-containing protein [Ktedonobacteraceae bacterium]
MKPRNPGLAPRSSRRSVLKGSLVGAAGLGAAGGLAALGAYISHEQDQGVTHAASADQGYGVTTPAANNAIKNILNIAITAEELAVVFYSHVIRNGDRLGFSNAGFLDIEAALIEEQIHQVFLAKQGARALTHRFSFPFGEDTFRHFNLFIKVQQQLEALFVAAYIAAGKEFARLGRPDLVQVAAQIGGVEAEHRAIGRAIGGMRPANNRAFETLLVNTVADAPGVLKRGGFLNPRPGNSFEFSSVSTNMNGLSGRWWSDRDWS